MKIIINFLLLIPIMIFILACKGEDKLKLELIHKIMEEPEKIDSLVINSNFYDEQTYKKFFHDVEGKNEKIDYIKKYSRFGYYYIDDEVSLLRKMHVNENEKFHYILLGFNDQHIGIIFSFKYNEFNKKWCFSSVGAHGLQL